MMGSVSKSPWPLLFFSFFFLQGSLTQSLIKLKGKTREWKKKKKRFLKSIILLECMCSEPADLLAGVEREDDLLSKWMSVGGSGIKKSFFFILLPPNVSKLLKMAIKSEKRFAPRSRWESKPCSLQILVQFDFWKKRSHDWVVVELAEMLPPVVFGLRQVLPSHVQTWRSGSSFFFQSLTSAQTRYNRFQTEV